MWLLTWNTLPLKHLKPNILYYFEILSLSGSYLAHTTCSQLSITLGTLASICPLYQLWSGNQHHLQRWTGTTDRSANIFTHIIGLYRDTYCYFGGLNQGLLYILNILFLFFLLNFSFRTHEQPEFGVQQKHLEVIQIPTETRNETPTSSSRRSAAAAAVTRRRRTSAALRPGPGRFPPRQPGEIDKTRKDLGVKKNCFLCFFGGIDPKQ